jgi:hypothetical protein
MALAPGAKPGSALRTLHASSQALALREEIKTLAAPAWRRLFYSVLVLIRKRRQIREAYADAAESPRPREPPVTTATFPLREKREGKSLIWASYILKLGTIQGRRNKVDESIEKGRNRFTFL